jgi:chemotaxis protein histidine kinase CheA/ActR/RegA family two-component response regulator
MSDIHEQDAEAGPQGEMLALLRAEFSDEQAGLQQTLAVIAAGDVTHAGVAEAVERYTDVVQRLWTTCQLLGLHGLQEVCSFINNNILAFCVQDAAERGPAGQLLGAWPDRVLDYLGAPTEEARCKNLSGFLQSAGWGAPLTDDETRLILKGLLSGPAAMDDAGEQSERPRSALAQDVVLTVQEDADRAQIDAFLQEAPAHVADFAACVQSIADGSASREDVQRAQRIAHTLKGAANLIGIAGVANLTHHLEDILEYLSARNIEAPADLIVTLEEAADCVGAMVDAVSGSDVAPANAVAVLQKVLDWAQRIDHGDLNSAARPASEAPRIPEAAPPLEAAASHAMDAPQQMLRVPTLTVDELLRLVGEMSMALAQVHDRLKRTQRDLDMLRTQDDVVQQRLFELGNLVDVRGVAVMRGRLQRTGTHDTGFDPLELNQYNELHGATQGIVEAVNDVRELSTGVRNGVGLIEDLVVQQGRLNKLLQQTVLSTRLIPMRTITQRLQRSVRQTCRATGKQARLIIDGEDLPIDGDVLQKLADPLMHILRNAIDHGLESIEQRRAAGKDETGSVRLSFARDGNTIRVRCRDDGRGLDYARIRWVAEERGLIEPEAELADTDLARLIFTSGFSTRTQATQTSGRGVGMDVVRTVVSAMKGSLDVRNIDDGGCEIELRLPVSLVTVHVLLLRQGEHVMAVPSSSLQQILPAGSALIEMRDDGLMCVVNDVSHPLHRLAPLVGFGDAASDAAALGARPVLLVRGERGLAAVSVDAVVDSREVVIKKLSRYVKGALGVSGTTILGDGAVVPVLDLSALLYGELPGAGMRSLESVDAALLRVSSAPLVLIVDDSLSVRKSLTQLVEDAGFESLQAKDGLEAIDVMNRRRPDLLLVDMEMPRMNGMELTAHVRAGEEARDIPIIMITSRSTDKHRQQATAVGVTSYVTKPYQDEVLLKVIEQALAKGASI